MLVAGDQRFRLIGDAHALAPHRQHLVVGHPERDVRFAAVVVLDQPVLALEAVPQRRARQRLQQVHGQHRDLRLLDELQHVPAGVGRVGVEADDDARHDLHAEAVQCLDGAEHRHHHVVLLGDRLERLGLGRLDAAEDRRERRLAHQLEDFRPLGDVERRLAGQQQRIAVALLPLDQVRQHLAHGALVGDEIVVDEIDRRGQAAGHELVELGANLLGGLVSRDAAVERRDVAEFALVRTAAGELDAAEQIAVDLRQLVGRHRKFAQLAPLFRGEHDLARRPRDIVGEPREQFVGGVAQFADVQIVELRIMLRTGRHRRAAQHGDPAEGVGAAPDVLDLPPLHMHAADEHHLGPGEIVVAGRRHVLVDEADLPGRRHRGGDDQQALRRHEGADAIGQRIGEFERAERGRVARKHAQDAPSVTACKHRAFSPEPSENGAAWTEIKNGDNETVWRQRGIRPAYFPSVAIEPCAARRYSASVSCAQVEFALGRDRAVGLHVLVDALQPELGPVELGIEDAEADRLRERTLGQRHVGLEHAGRDRRRLVRVRPDELLAAQAAPAQSRSRPADSCGPTRRWR